MQLIINSRVVGYFSWQKIVERGFAIVLGEDHIEVFAFGLGTVYVNGIPVSKWDGPLVKNLFLFSVDRHTFTREEIFETFWPSLSKKEATNVWHVSKRKISEQLGYDLLTYSGGFYNLSDELVIHYDARQFDELCAAAESADRDDNISYYWQTIKLYRSEYLHLSEGISWIRERREQRRNGYGNALIQIGRMYESNQQFVLAIAYYLRALRELPLREDIHRKLIELYTQSDQTDKAVQQYQRLEALLRRRLNIAPAKETVALFQSIHSKQNSG